MQKCDTVSSCCSIISKFGFVRVCYIHSHVLCDHLPGIYLVILACMPTAVMYACWHWCSTYLFRMALETCLVNACRHTRCSCSFVCSLFIIIAHMHLLVNKCLHDSRPCRHTRCSCSFVCSLFIIIAHMHLLVNKCLHASRPYVVFETKCERQGVDSSQRCRTC